MKVVSCLLVGLDVPVSAVAKAALAKEFPRVAVVELATVAAVWQRPVTSTGELLVVAQPAPEECHQLLTATDAHGLPRWGVIVIGERPQHAGCEVMAPGDWNATLAGHVFRAVAQHLDLKRENARLRGDLLTIAHRISHDLRTPLGGVISAGEVLKEVIADVAPAEAELARPLFDSAETLGRLVNRVSLLTKASAKPVAQQTVVMQEVIWAVTQRHERQLLQHKTRLTHPEEWPNVAGVPAWLEVIWGNLLANAMQHGREGGDIHLSWQPAGEDYRFQVTNVSDPIPAERVASLFQPFHELHRPDARKGLGLSIVQRLVELQGGECGYEALPDGQVAFYFTLPGKAAEPSPKQAPFSGAAGSTG